MQNRTQPASIHARTTVLIKSVLALLLVLGLLLAAGTTKSVAATPDISPPTANQSSTSPAPAGLKAIGQDAFGIELAWTSWNQAPQYRVKASLNADMSDATFHRFTTTTADVRGLKPNTTYYFQVRAITADGNASLSPYSVAISAKTAPAGAAATPAPTGLKSGSQSSSTIALAWDAWGNAPQYRVQLASKADRTDATYFRFTETAADMRGLKPSTTYYFRVRAISADGNENLSDYSSSIVVQTKAAAPLLPPADNPLSVASFNIACANCFSGRDNELQWAERRPAVVTTITSQMPDVLGVQEASQGWLHDDERPGGISQFEDLQERLNSNGAAYQLTNNKRNNCLNHATPTNCVYEDHGASQGTRLLFNTATVEMITQGTKEIPAITETDNKRYFVWGIFKQKSSGQKFFIGNTHLEPASGADYYGLRQQQAEAIISETKRINSGNLPVFITGDFNSNKWTTPTNAPYDVLTQAGYSDPLGNTYASDYPSRAATVERRIGTFYDSYNGYQRKASARHDYGNGTYLDYIFTSKMRVMEWETVVNVDSAGNFTGTIPSDHNMIRVSVQLPPSSAATPRVFSDVPTRSQFFDEISWLASTGISTGWTEPNGTKTFRPVQPVNRDAMAAFMYRAAGSPSFKAPTRSPFSDISTKQQFYKEMAWLASSGISTGWTEPNGTKTFRALQPVNRDAMAAFMYRAAGSPSFKAPTRSPFSDISTKQQFYKEIAWLASKRISTGWTEANGTKTYRALQPVNRDAMAAFMFRYDAQL